MLMRAIGHPPAILANRVTRIRQRSFRQSRVAGGGPWLWGVAFKRGIHVPAVVAPPLILTGLFVALWTWKCTMLVLFQNTIIYNPFMPPDARSLRIAEFARQCGGIKWREERIRSLDGTEIALCVSDEGPGVATCGGSSSKTPVYILYFQGNASSLPPRLPDLSWVLRRLRERDDDFRYTMVCVSYRGYWTSHDRPYEAGINKDAEAALRWVSEIHHRQDPSKEKSSDPIVVLYGQSIGCGFATNLAATTDAMRIDALVLETPFTSARDMLRALYPQRWLPYQYLWPFLWNHLDSWTNLGTIARRATGRRPPSVHMIEAGKDELVPADLGQRLYERCKDVGLPVERHKVRGALHNEAIVRVQGKDAIARSIASAVAGVRVGGSQAGKGATG